MKRLSNLIFVTFLIALFFVQGVPHSNAQVGQSGVPPLSVNILGTSFNNSARTLSTEIEVINNTNHFVDDLEYRLELYRGESLGETGLIFSEVEFVVADVDSLEKLYPNQERKQTLEFKLPRNIPGDSYFLRLIVNNSDRSYYGINYTENPIRLTGLGGFIPYIDAALITPDDGEPHLLMEGPILDKEDTPFVAILEKRNPELFSKLEEEDLFVSYETVHITEPDVVVDSSERVSMRSLLRVDAGAVEVKFAPWGEIRSGSHTATLHFTNQRGDQIAPDLTVRLLYEGLLGRIYEANTSVNSYRRGEPIDLQVNVVTGGDISASKVVLEATLRGTNGKEQLVSKDILLNGTFQGIDEIFNFIEEKSKHSMVVEEIMLELKDQDGNKLDEHLIEMDTDVIFGYERGSNALQVTMILILVLIVVAVVAGILHKKSRHVTGAVAVALAFVGTSLFYVNPGIVLANHTVTQDSFGDVFVEIPADTNFEDSNDAVPQLQGDLLSGWSSPINQPSGYDGICEIGERCVYITHFIKLQCKECGNQGLDLEVNFFNDWNHTSSDFRVPSGAHDRQIIVNTADLGSTLDYGYYSVQADPEGEIVKEDSIENQIVGQAPEGQLSGVPVNANDIINWWIWGPFIFEMCWIEVDERLLDEWGRLTGGENTSAQNRLDEIDGFITDYENENPGETADDLRAERDRIQTLHDFMTSETASLDFILNTNNGIDILAAALERYRFELGQIEQFYNIQARTRFGAGYCELSYESGDGPTFIGIYNSVRQLWCDLPGAIEGTFFIDENDNKEFDVGESYVKDVTAPANCSGVEGGALGRVRAFPSSTVDYRGLKADDCRYPTSTKPFFGVGDLNPGTYLPELDPISGWEQTVVLMDVDSGPDTDYEEVETVTVDPNSTTTVLIGIKSDFPVVLSCTIDATSQGVSGGSGGGSPAPGNSQNDGGSGQGSSGVGGGGAPSTGGSWSGGGSGWGGGGGGGGGGEGGGGQDECPGDPNSDLYEEPTLEITSNDGHDLPECIPTADDDSCDPESDPYNYHMIGTTVKLTDPCYPDDLWFVKTYFEGTLYGNWTRKHGDEWDVTIDTNYDLPKDGSHTITSDGWKGGQNNGTDEVVAEDKTVDWPGVCECEGCTYSDADNSNPEATIDDGSCICNNGTDFYQDLTCDPVDGCIYPEADNYNSYAHNDDGSCWCDNGSDFYDDFSCDYVVYGCTYEDAYNFNAGATNDDGTCTCENGDDFYDNYACDIYGCTHDEWNVDNYDSDATQDDGSCSCANGADFYNGIASNSCDLEGCTTFGDANYDAGANIHNSQYCTVGCTNPTDNNYDSGATIHDGSYCTVGCTTPSDDSNYNPGATVHDSDACAGDGSV